jgi:hypothetical protein
MIEKNYNLENLEDTFYLFNKENEVMIDEIKNFALRYREKIAANLGLDEKEAGLMQVVLNKAIWSNKILDENNKSKNFLDYFLNWNKLAKNPELNKKIVVKFLESKKLTDIEWEKYFIINGTQLKRMLGGSGLIGEIKKQMKQPPLSIDIFNLRDQYQEQKITKKQYEYYQKMEQNLFELITHHQLFSVIKKNCVAKKSANDFLIMRNLAKQELKPKFF